MKTALAEQTGFTFDEASHIGRMDGQIWPSVTQLLNEFKLINYDGVPSEILERKRILGTRVHKATALLDNCELDEEHFNKRFPECIPYLDAYRKFRVIEKFDPGDKVGRLVSKKWKFHGEPDEHGLHIGFRGAVRVLIDYKCTFKMFASTGPQDAGYAMLFDENFGIKIKERYGLLLKPNGNYELHPFNDKNDFQDFQACLWLWWQRVNKYQTLNADKLKGETE